MRLPRDVDGTPCTAHVSTSCCKVCCATSSAQHACLPACLHPTAGAAAPAAEPVGVGEPLESAGQAVQDAIARGTQVASRPPADGVLCGRPAAASFGMWRAVCFVLSTFGLSNRLLPPALLQPPLQEATEGVQTAAGTVGAAVGGAAGVLAAAVKSVNDATGAVVLGGAQVHHVWSAARVGCAGEFTAVRWQRRRRRRACLATHTLQCMPILAYLPCACAGDCGSAAADPDGRDGGPSGGIDWVDVTRLGAGALRRWSSLLWLAQRACGSAVV